MSKTATLIKRLSGFTGDARLYKLSEPLGYTDSDMYDHVVVSAVNVMFSGPETYIFGADENGETVNWIELDGSFEGGLDHERALRDAGYTVLGE